MRHNVMSLSIPHFSVAPESKEDKNLSHMTGVLVSASSPFLNQTAANSVVLIKYCFLIEIQLLSK